MEVVDVTSCVECRTFWSVDTDQSACVRSDHTHRSISLHRHHDRVELPEGASVVGVSFDPAAPYLRDRAPDYGLYLDRRWQPPWPHDHLDWPDFGAPADVATVRAALDGLLRRARAGDVVEIGCLGGHGRTGTALACLAVRTGLPARRAVDWVRAGYCRGAVETPDQEQFVRQFQIAM